MSTESTKTPPPIVDVLIIGMGPVGKMAALLMARAGHSVLVTERKPGDYTLPRAVAHDAEIARILQSVGLRPDSIPDAIEPYDDLYVWVNGHDEVLHEVDWRGIDPSGWNNTYFYNQPALEAHLNTAIRETATEVHILRSTSARVQAQDDTGVDVELTDIATGRVSNVRASFVLGADGGNSGTRRSLDISWKDLGYFYDWLVVDVVPKDGLKITHLAKQVCDPLRPTTVVPGGPGRRRWEFMCLKGETAEELTKPERIWELLAPFGVTPETAHVERGVVYTFNSGWAAEWRRGRVLLLGDAAHLMPPFAGQGLAAGFRDCVNLAWKLDLVLRGVAADGILDSFGPERQMHVADFIEFSMSLGRIICITDPEQARLRDLEMMTARANGVTPEPPPAPRLGSGLHQGDKGGYLSWQGQVDVAPFGGRARFDDTFGAGALILRDNALANTVPSQDLAALRSLGIAVTTFGTADSSGPAVPFVDLDGTYAAWFAELDADAVLVRPDFYVFGTATDAASVSDLVSAYLDRIIGVCARLGTPLGVAGA